MKIKHLTHTWGDQFDKTVTFDQDVSTFAELALSIRATWLEEGETDATALAQSTIANGGTTRPGAATTARFVIEHTVMRSQLPPGSYVYDIQGTTAAGKPYTAMRGEFVVGNHATYSV